MNVMIFTSSPNIDGLTAACGRAARTGAEEAGAQVVMVDLNKQRIGQCKACGNGWGPCRDKHECQVQDDFQGLHASMAGMDAYILITPVYWGEMSESAKAFFDRLRRCEALKKDKNLLQGKSVIAVAAAGGSGNGLTTCLTSMERFLAHAKAEKFDLIGVTQKNRTYKLNTILNAAREMVVVSNRKGE
ncbi:flavodoxin family protein [Desulfosporosinus metallidurans]|uniref:Iron-sulfur flavoprotein n=1 Tax=Desulfosporosinus metallidurans TaxID=1888891 RepID=A0A1Q8QW78_9FIRM|nr:flavodoxin family protein [Desulfosporosinus metallidurans]OLN31578.1 iron-sulfur flavoprotein [Desulfosporosinus metallidurans]